MKLKKTVIDILNNRNLLLVTALIVGLLYGKGVHSLKHLTLYILMIVMAFSTTSFNFKQLKDFRYFLKTTAISFFLNFIVFGAIVVSLAHLAFKDKTILYGFVIIAATPPGVAIVPFTFLFKGNNRFSLIGVLGVYLSAIIITPLIIKLFIHNSNVNMATLLIMTIKLILLPIAISRILNFKKIKPSVEKIRGKVVNWGFALIIYTVVGLNRSVIFNDINLFIKISVVFIIAMFFAGIVYDLLFKNKLPKKTRISQNLMLTIKSSGFSAGLSLALLGEKSALPSAVLAIFVLIYLIFLDYYYRLTEKEKQITHT